MHASRDRPELRTPASEERTVRESAAIAASAARQGHWPAAILTALEWMSEECVWVRHREQVPWLRVVLPPGAEDRVAGDHWSLK